jgi:hypothetical protein
MLGLVKSCIGTKFTSQFGDLIAVSIFLSARFPNVILCSFVFTII